MNIQSARFITSAVKPSQYPSGDLPEIAFAGRSNVGKSSLINTLVNRKRLVKTSRTPGRTQLINFFSINEQFMLVDLPGYGYARVPAAVRKKWGPMIERYLAERNRLRGVVLILDIRRMPDERERSFIAWLEQCQLPVVLVLTKADKLSTSAQSRRYREIVQAIDSGPLPPVLFSAKTGRGRDAVWKTIQTLIRPES
ncbi:MAG: YihA family ribosome biogenesis GTP-binding protein [Deltaproteobacteria bacterium]|nr:MAG: YihA family ribosome biogenesis GTP-binding protein [Deltaproteobacteria bacterium]RUA01313.1 MAG: YihA family ribosome biogenesis GTP-binding protein [Deltaproteobacteria bacterium]